MHYHLEAAECLYYIVNVGMELVEEREALDIGGGSMSRSSEIKVHRRRLARSIMCKHPSPTNGSLHSLSIIFLPSL